MMDVTFSTSGRALHEELVWSLPHRGTTEGVTAQGLFVISDDLLCVGIETVTWTRAGSNSSSRTFPSSASPAGFSYQARPTGWWSDNILGFWATHYVDWQPAYRNHQRMVRVPWWSVWLISAAIAWKYCSWWWRSGLRERRTRAGLCLACGYDLRASPEHCPECGQGVTRPQ